MGREEKYEWIGERLDGSQISFHEAGTWEIIEKLTEKSCQSPGYHLPPYEAIGVFVCKKTSGSNADERAIMKIRVE